MAVGAPFLREKLAPQAVGKLEILNLVDERRQVEFELFVGSI